MSDHGHRHSLIESLRADVHERTEAPDGVMRLIIGYKAVSAVLLLAVALLLLGIIVDRDWGTRMRMIIVLTGMRANNHLLRDTLLKFGLLGRRSTTALGIISLFYAALEATEVFGLLNRRRWAEYLTFVVTTSLLPLEIYEIANRATVFKVIAFVINLAVVVYLLRAKRLFGLRGGLAAEHAENELDVGWEALERTAPPDSPLHAPG